MNSVAASTLAPTPTPVPVPVPVPAPALVRWTEASVPYEARWRSENGAPVPSAVEVIDDRCSADAAWRHVQAGTGLLWRGDYVNARNLLTALARRADRPPRQPRPVPATPGAAWAQQRQTQARRARLLSLLLLEIDADHRLALRRAPEVQAAVSGAWGAPVAGQPTTVLALRELLGLIGAHEWRKKGVAIAALGGDAIHPHFGVFSPVRGEYLDLLAHAPLPAGVGRGEPVFDIGTGTGVVAAVLARRGATDIIATDLDPRALACAAENFARLGVAGAIALQRVDLFPPAEAGLAALIVCNPPWVPATPNTPIEAAVYDPDSRMLRAFLAGLAARLAPGGEGWLVMSDLAEHLGLRPAAALAGWIDAAGLRVLQRHDIRPRHAKAHDASDPLHAARAAEVTSLWRLTRR
jgi:SAM-dependent methyltransferase